MAEWQSREGQRARDQMLTRVAVLSRHGVEELNKDRAKSRLLS